MPPSLQGGSIDVGRCSLNPADENEARQIEVADHLSSATRAHYRPDKDWLALNGEQAIEPALRIVDPHHHIWDPPGNRYMFDDLLEDFQSGHNIIASVYVQTHAMSRARGPELMRPVGETEFANGVAAQSASGNYGSTQVCAGIVGSADIQRGAEIERLLEAHICAAGGRFRGIRPTTAWHESSQVRILDVTPNLLMQQAARDGIACIARAGLTLDLWLFFTQLDDALDVCRRFPELSVIINHCGGPLGIGPYADRKREAFESWREKVVEVARCPNAVMKIGGLAMRYAGFDFNKQSEPPSSDLLAQSWKPFVDVCIEAFGPSRCMFESNFPVDKGMCGYVALWNAFKKLTVHHSADDREWLFHKTAITTYKLDLDGAA